MIASRPLNKIKDIILAKSTVIIRRYTATFCGDSSNLSYNLDNMRIDEQRTRTHQGFPCSLPILTTGPGTAPAAAALRSLLIWSWSRELRIAPNICFTGMLNGVC